MKKGSSSSSSSSSSSNRSDDDDLFDYFGGTANSLLSSKEKRTKKTSVVIPELEVGNNIFEVGSHWLPSDIHPDVIATVIASLHADQRSRHPTVTTALIKQSKRDFRPNGDMRLEYQCHMKKKGVVMPAADILCTFCFAATKKAGDIFCEIKKCSLEHSCSLDQTQRRNRVKIAAQMESSEILQFTAFAQGANAYKVIRHIWTPKYSLPFSSVTPSISLPLHLTE